MALPVKPVLPFGAPATGRRGLRLSLRPAGGGPGGLARPAGARRRRGNPRIAGRKHRGNRSGRSAACGRGASSISRTAGAVPDGDYAGDQPSPDDGEGLNVTELRKRFTSM